MAKSTTKYLRAIRLNNGRIVTGRHGHAHHEIKKQHSVFGPCARGFIKDGKFYPTFVSVARDFIL